MNTFVKAPLEKTPVRFNVSADLLPSEVIVAAAVACVDAATGVSSKAEIVTAETIFTTEVLVVLGGGGEGDEHHVECIMETSRGNTFQRDLMLAIRTDVSDSFIKQPDDEFLAVVDFTQRLDPGDTLTSSVVWSTKEADGAVASVASSEGVISPKAGVLVSGGEDKDTFLLFVLGTTSIGYAYQKTIRMIVMER